MHHQARRTCRVLHVISDTNRRGAQVFAVDLSAAMASAGDDSRVVALTSGAAGAQLDAPVLGPGVRAARTWGALRREMRSADVVVSHGSATLLACSAAGLGLGARLVYRNISDPSYWLSSWTRRFRVRAQLSRVSHVVALWPGGADYLVRRLRVDPARVTVIPNGVPSADFWPPDDRQRRECRARFGLPVSATVLVYVAALQPEKHPELAIAALTHLPEDTHLLVMGDGPMRGVVEEQARRTAPGRVVFAGQVADPVEGYRAADAIVLPSEGEGLPAVLIEAALCGLPGVVSPSGGNADIVRDGETGRVVDPHSASTLAAAVTEVLARRDDLGVAAREHCLGRYDMDSVTDQWRTVLAGSRSVLEQGAGR